MGGNGRRVARGGDGGTNVSVRTGIYDCGQCDECPIADENWVVSFSVDVALLLAYVVLIASITFQLNAQHVCFNPRTSTNDYQTAPCTTDEWKAFAYPCDVVRGLPSCNPPATMTYRTAAVPFNAPVTFGGEEVRNGVRLWRYVKAGEASRPCTAVEAARVGYAFWCGVKVGETLYLAQRMQLNPNPPALSASPLFALRIAATSAPTETWTPEVVCPNDRIGAAICTAAGCYQCSASRANPSRRYHSDPTGQFLIEDALRASVMEGQ